jgi:hypothetical protein
MVSKGQAIQNLNFKYEYIYIYDEIACCPFELSETFRGKKKKIPIGLCQFYTDKHPNRLFN